MLCIPKFLIVLRGRIQKCSGSTPGGLGLWLQSNSGWLPAKQAPKSCFIISLSPIYILYIQIGWIFFTVYIEGHNISSKWDKKITIQIYTTIEQYNYTNLYKRLENIVVDL